MVLSLFSSLGIAVWPLVILTDIHSGWMVLLVFSITGYGIYYILNYVKVPELIVGNKRFRTFLETHAPITQQKSWPTPWLTVSPFLHTVVGALLSVVLHRKPKYRREILTLWDGGQVALDWLDTPDKNFSTIVLFIPGMMGDEKAGYFREPLEIAHAKNCTCVVANYRSLGNVPLKNERLFSATNVEDVENVIDHIHTLHPQSVLIGFGVSLGGIQLIRYVSERGNVASQHLTAVMTVDPGWKLERVHDNLERGLNKIFNALIRYELQKVWLNEENLRVLKTDNSGYKFDQVMKCRTGREFDSAYTAPYFGYRDVHHYFQDAALLRFLNDVTVPTLAINCGDDPFVPFDSIPFEHIRQSQRVALVYQTVGGHIGHREGLFGQRCFSSRLWEQFLTAVVAHADELKAL